MFIILFLQAFIEIIFGKNFKEVTDIIDELLKHWHMVTICCIATMLVISLMIWTFISFPQNILANLPLWLNFAKKLIDHYYNNSKEK